MIIFNQEAEGNAFLYSHSNWEIIDEPLEGLARHHTEWSELIKFTGYEHNSIKFGKVGIFHIEVHDSVKNHQPHKAPHKYLVKVFLGTRHQHVYVDDYPSLLQLLKDIMPICSFTSLSE